MHAKFSGGAIVATPGALDALVLSGERPGTYLERHFAGDWGLTNERGEVDAHDWEANEQALLTGSRLLSAYWLPGKTKLWIITEADRSVTTLLLPDEY